MEYDASVRRLPVYMLIDCSSSMNGDAIEAVYQGFRNLTTKLSNDPNTCDIVWFSIIAYDSVPRQLFPLSPIGHYKGISLDIGGSSNMGRALKFLLNDRIVNEVRKQTKERKGDWKPLVFLMSDGKPSDEWESVKQDISTNMNIVACGVGADADIDSLRKLTDLVVILKDMTQETFDQFIDFLSSTMTTASQRSEGRSDKLMIEPKYTRIVLS